VRALPRSDQGGNESLERLGSARALVIEGATWMTFARWMTIAVLVACSTTPREQPARAETPRDAPPRANATVAAAKALTRDFRAVPTAFVLPQPLVRSGACWVEMTRLPDEVLAARVRRSSSAIQAGTCRSNR
jgi:hypothetical protein